MPRKKGSKNKKDLVIKQPQVTRSKSFSLNKLNFQDSYVSLFLGALVVVVVAVLFFVLLKGFREARKINFSDLRAQLQQQLNVKEKPTSAPMKVSNENTYTVKDGDSLWSIAQTRYGNGFRWVEILAVNDISNPNFLYVGTKLNLPNAEEGSQMQKSYTVKDGDSLWNIALNKYGDGYKWVEIAKINNLQNPNWINPGQALKLP